MSRTLVAAIAGPLGFVLYVGAVLALADALAPMHWAVQAVFFVAAGTLWVFPAKWLMFWAARKSPGRAAGT